MQFTNLWHHVYNVNRLREAYFGLNPQSAPGIDGQRWSEYGLRLEENLKRLSEELRDCRYRASAVRRHYIEKSDGRMRPIGIPTLEDKIVQRATAEVLNAVYEVEFKGFSYGFRPGRSQHRALDALYIALMKKRVNWVLDADIQAFFDTIDHQWLLKFIGHRINDSRLLRHIAKWLKAGVMEEGNLTRNEEGTPQGGSISPLLSNIYLHYVLDLWVEQWRKRHAHGDVKIVRYADDFVMGFEHKAEAAQFLADLRERFTKFNLTLHPQKTRLIEFGRHAATNRKRRGEGKPETFGFLGFTHICDVTRARGKFIVLRQTIRKRMGAKLQEIKEELRDRMHDPIPQTGKWLRAVIGGYYRYHAVPRNLPAMNSFYRRTAQLWNAALNRRSHKADIGWKQMYKIVDRWLPSPKVMHPYPEHRFGVIT
jgi:group II intron reverse transcriptase/maturase